jgi:hypothetical protein
MVGGKVSLVLAGDIPSAIKPLLAGAKKRPVGNSGTSVDK